jgi:hypothetical protein
VELDHVGLNHLTWIREVRVGDEDVLPRVIEEHGADLAARLELPLDLIRELRLIPSYYLRYYYAHDEVVAELLREGTRAAQVQRIEAELLELYREKVVMFEQITPLGDLTIRWTGSDDGEVDVTDEFDVEREVDQQSGDGPTTEGVPAAEPLEDGASDE